MDAELRRIQQRLEEDLPGFYISLKEKRKHTEIFINNTLIPISFDRVNISEVPTPSDNVFYSYLYDYIVKYLYGEI